MKNLVAIILMMLLSFELCLCVNPTKRSDGNMQSVDKKVPDSIVLWKHNFNDKYSLLATNKQVWDSIGWVDSTFLGINMPFYKMVECGEPVSFDELKHIYEYADLGILEFKDMLDKPVYPLKYSIGWSLWQGKESILTRIGDFPIKVRCFIFNVDEENCILMYYKCENNNSLTPIDGFAFNLYENPWIGIEPPKRKH